MFWTVLWNPQYPESKTLFGVRRVTDFDSLATEPLNNRWTLRVDYARMQHYTWPREFMSLSALEFSPVMTQQVTNTEGINSFVRIEDPANVKALYAIVTFTDRAGPCAPPIGEPATEGGLPPNNGKGYRCGRELTSSDITLHNLVAAQSFRGTLTYNAAEPVYCQCPSALVQLNVNYRGAIATANSRMTLGNAALDASGEPYTILKWMDPNYETWRTWNTNSLTSAQLTEEPSASLVPFLSSMMAMQPSPTGSVVDELPASFYFANYNMPIVDERTPGELDPRFTTDTEGVTAPRPSADRSDAEENPYGIWEYTIGTDIAKVNAVSIAVVDKQTRMAAALLDALRSTVTVLYAVIPSPLPSLLTSLLSP